MTTAAHGVGYGDSRQPVLHPNPKDMTFTATTDQQLKAEMAIRFKAIKMGATCTQVNLWTLNEVLIFIGNHA